MGNFIDMTGWVMKEHGIPDSRITIIKRIEDKIISSGLHLVNYSCLCECGTIFSCIGQNIRRGSTKSCGCLEKELKKEGKRKAENLINQTFGNLKVNRRGPNIYNNEVSWFCDCACGKKDVLVTSRHLKSGHTTSCGCARIKKNKERKKHNIFDLTNDYGICYLKDNTPILFDLEDYDLIKDYYWIKDANNYVVSRIQYNKKVTVIKMHRLVMKLTNEKDKIVDHIKHNTFDNRKKYLRVVSYSQNNQNQKISSVNSSGYTGVCWDKRKNKWRAYITINKKRIELGWYIEKELAIKARKIAEEKYFGKYSYKNSMKEE